jgi:aspartate/methionine/tyrosine aminotransferase
MFSSRLKRQPDPNRISIAIESRRRSGDELLDLTVSNPTQAEFEYPTEGILAALADERSLVYEPHPCGLITARCAIAKRYTNVSAEQIVLTASTSEAYSYLFKLLCDPGDEILVPQPSYPLFEFLAELESVRIRYYPLSTITAGESIQRHYVTRLQHVRVQWCSSIRTIPPARF